MSNSLDPGTLAIVSDAYTRRGYIARDAVRDSQRLLSDALLALQAGDARVVEESIGRSLSHLSRAVMALSTTPVI